MSQRPASAARIIARRLAVLPFVLLAVAALTFGLIAVSPFDATSAYTGISGAVSEQTREEINAASDRASRGSSTRCI